MALRADQDLQPLYSFLERENVDPVSHRSNQAKACPLSFQIRQAALVNLGNSRKRADVLAILLRHVTQRLYLAAR